MRLLRRLVGIVVGLAGLAGLLLCIAGIVGCWLVHSEIARRVDRAFGRADSTLAQASENLEQVENRLKQTRTELSAIRKREADVASQPPAEKTARRSLSRKAIASSNPKLVEAREMLVKAMEISLLANGLLEALGELPLCERANIDVDRLKETSNQLSELNERTTKLTDLLAKVAPNGDVEIAHESSRAGEILDRIVTGVDDGSKRIDSARAAVSGYHARIDMWLGRVAIAITVLLSWIGAGQLSLLIHGKKLTFCTKKPAV